ncbi:MAG: glycosyltransferase [Bacteroidales bacterium]|nr:glycosyltransferase [Bacteroidales bacterium]
MKILFVVNNYYSTGNGLSASARRTVSYLKEAGEDVRVLSGANHNASSPQPDYVLKDYRVPFFDGLIRSHGYSFAAADRKIIREAVEWADVVHLEEPFYIQAVTARIASSLGVPCTATYHLHPENLFCSVHLGGWTLLNRTLLRMWRDLVFNWCSDIQCPTGNVLHRLEKERFASRLHLISNGIIPEKIMRKDDPEREENGPFRVVCIGRLAVEKDQMTLLRAMRECRHSDRIQLIFAGRGPEEKHLKGEAEKLLKEGVLRYGAQFAFMDRDGLRELSSGADLYIHCATVEVEGLSALEALEQGVVPIIAEGELTATGQFALDGRSLFPSGDSKLLASKIDYWLDNPEERRRMGKLYAESTRRYDISSSIASLRRMFRQATPSRRKGFFGGSSMGNPLPAAR